MTMSDKKQKELAVKMEQLLIDHFGEDAKIDLKKIVFVDNGSFKMNIQVIPNENLQLSEQMKKDFYHSFGLTSEKREVTGHGVGKIYEIHQRRKKFPVVVELDNGNYIQMSMNAAKEFLEWTNETAD